MNDRFINRMRNLTVYILITCATFVLGLAANRARLLIVREKLSPIVDSCEFTSFEPSDVRKSTAYDPCDEPLEIVRTGFMIRATPFSVIKACVETDQAKAHPLIDAKRAKSILEFTRREAEK